VKKVLLRAKQYQSYCIVFAAVDLLCVNNEL